MSIVIDLDAHRPDSTPEPLDPAGHAQVIHFPEQGRVGDEVLRLQQRVNDLAHDYPDPDEYEEGHVTLHTDGVLVAIIELVVDENGHRYWDARTKYDQKKLISHFYDRSAHRRRTQRRIKQLNCAHTFNRRECTKCGAEKPRKYRNCRSRPTSWTWRKKDGTKSCFERSPTCRRRLGHEGDCSWEHDPCCHKGPNWRRPSR